MSNTDDLKQQIADLTKMLEEFREGMRELGELQNVVKHDEDVLNEEYRERSRALRERKQKIDSDMYDIRVNANKVEQNKWKLEAELEEARKAAETQLKAQALQDEWADLNKTWDMLTAGAPWREWAKDHQITGAKKITADAKVILADPMGLGKTLTAIITSDIAEAATRMASPLHPMGGIEKEQYSYATGSYENVVTGGIEKPCGRKILYFCPATMVKNVMAEYRLWAKHRSVIFIAGMSKAERNFAIQHVLPLQKEYVLICNYEAWRKDHSLLESLIGCDFDTVIIDEAHNIKNMKSSGYTGIKKILDQMQPPYVIPMTGTPILNRPQELFTLLTLVNPDEFWNEMTFLRTYCEQDPETNRWKFKPGGLDMIIKKISTNILRRTKDQAGIVLPPKTVTRHRLTPDPEKYPNQARVREQMTKNAIIQLQNDKSISAAARIAIYTRLRQVETWPAGIRQHIYALDEDGNKIFVDKNPIIVETIEVDVEESQKIDYLIAYNKEENEFEGLIPEVIEDERVILFSQFKAPLREIKDRIERLGKTAIILDGDTPSDIKEQIRIDFDNRHAPDRSASKWDAVLCNYKVGGVGMNLTAATQMMILDEEWNPGKRDQAYDRFHRMGQDKPVTIHVIHNETTIDDWLETIMEEKEDLVDGFNKASSDRNDKFMDFLESGLA